MDAFARKCKNKSFFLSIEQTSGKMFPLEMAIFHSIEITKLFKQGQYCIRIRAENRNQSTRTETRKRNDRDASFAHRYRQDG